MDHPHRLDYPGDEVPDYFFVRTVCPAIIVEPEFIYERAAIQGKREAACRVIAAALIEGHRLLCTGGMNRKVYSVNPLPQFSHAKWYYEHLHELSPEAFQAVTNVLFDRTPILCRRVPRMSRSSA